MNAVLSTFPLLTCVYKPPFFPVQLTQWFYDTMNEAVKYRNQNQSNRKDFLDFLLQRKQIKNHTNDDLAAFAATFLFNGFETSSMILAQALYHVAKNEHHQMQLRAEISKYFPDGKCPTADIINEMQYLDNIVNGLVVCNCACEFCLIFVKMFKIVFFLVETIRIGPSAFLLAKNCTQAIELCDFDGTKLLVEPGTSIQLPVYAIAHDDRFYDEPNSFKPQRFEFQPANELKKSGKFLPFGNGPRICLGKSKSNQFDKVTLTLAHSAHSVARPKICCTSNKISFGGDSSLLFDCSELQNM